MLKDGKVIAQGMMTYTPKLGSVDLTLTAAVDVRVKKADREVKRAPNAANFDGTSYWRVDLAGTVGLTNAGPKPVEVEVTRSVLGTLDTVGAGATAERVNVLEDDAAGGARPAWWGYYSWPGWWSHVNGVGRATWTVKLAPGQSAEQAYAWHYFWR